MPQRPSTLELVIPKKALDWAAGAVREPKRIAISLSALTPLKRYLRWTDVVMALAQALPDYAILLVGMQRPEASLKGFRSVYDWTTKTSLVELAALTQSAAVVAGTDGLVTNLSASLGIPTVALFSIIRPDFVIDPARLQRRQVLALTTGECPKQFCYSLLGNYRSALCPHEPGLSLDSAPICMQFSPKHILEAILSQLEST